jgi:hypothetical protein
VVSRGEWAQATSSIRNAHSLYLRATSRRRNARDSSIRYLASCGSSKRTHTDPPPHRPLGGYLLPGCLRLAGSTKISIRQRLGGRGTAQMLGSSIIAQLGLLTLRLEVYMGITETEFVKTSSFHSKMLKKTKWCQPILTSQPAATTVRSLTT